MSLRMTVNISQRPMLVMTPKLQQAIKILQMHRLELTQYISQQMEENFVLEETFDEVDESEALEGDNKESALEDKVSEVDVDLDTGLPDNNTAGDTPELDIANENFGDIDWAKYFEDSTPDTKNEWEAPLEDDVRDNVASTAESLEEHLFWQLRMSVNSEDDYAIGEAIIGNIDDDGYLTTSIQEIAESLKRDAADVERVLKAIQTFEPTGVGARDLKECLLIQLQQLNLQDTVAYKIVEKDYLDFLVSNRLPQLAKELEVEMEVVRAAVKVIASLEPKPGRQFGSEKSEYIVPDVTVEKVDGKYRIFMNDYGPRLRLNPYYWNLLNSRNFLPNETREFIKSKIQSATWLIENIESRRATILKVTESILDIQKDFLDEGAAYLKPLTLKDIAVRLGIHESTVSRVTRNRYVQTPQGVFELKYFFNSGISTESGGMTSSASVREMIKEIVNNEDPKKTLSDSGIEKVLKQRGIEIARRTIAKYREELNIPPSSKRKKW